VLDGPHDPEGLVSPAAVLAGLSSATAVLVSVAPRPRAGARVRALVAPRGDRPTEEPRPTTAPAAVALRVGLAAVEAVGRRVRHGCRRRPDAALDRRAGGAVVVAVAALVVVPWSALPATAVAWVLPVLHQRARQRRGRARRAADAPDLVELFRLAIGAGLSVGQAVDAVAARAPASWATAVAEVPARVGLGLRLGDALEHFGTLDESVRPLAGALVAAERYGVPLGATLDRLADDARQQRRRRAEEVARRLPVQMLFPLVLCILPAFGLLTVVPLVATAIGGLPR
jgi:tight adherence protein C